jgi:hypothetical protein
MAWITTEEAAALADTHPNYIAQVGQWGKIRRRRQGKKWLYWSEDVIQWDMTRRGPRNPGKYKALPVKKPQLLLAAPVGTPGDLRPEDILDEPTDHLAAGKIIAKWPDIECIDHLLDVVSDYDQTSEEAKKELEDDGVDVEAFIARAQFPRIQFPFFPPRVSRSWPVVISQPITTSYLVQVGDSFDDTPDLDAAIKYAAEVADAEIETSVWKRVAVRFNVEAEETDAC